MTINGIVAGNYFALGAVGLTLIFGVLRLVNFAHGEFLTFGAYMLVAGNALGLPLVVVGRVRRRRHGGARRSALEVALWRPVRRKRVGELQLLLLALGLAFFMRNAIAFVAGPEDRASGREHHRGVSARRAADRADGADRDVVGLVVIVLVAVGLQLHVARAGRRARSPTASSSPRRPGSTPIAIVLITWAASGGLAGLAGILYALPAGRRESATSGSR